MRNTLMLWLLYACDARASHFCELQLPLSDIDSLWLHYQLNLHVEIVKCFRLNVMELCDNLPCKNGPTKQLNTFDKRNPSFNLGKKKCESRIPNCTPIRIDLSQTNNRTYNKRTFVCHSVTLLVSNFMCVWGRDHS